MRTLLLLAGCCLGLAAPVSAQESLTVGVAAPLTGPSSILGRQIAAGAGEAAGTRATVIAADTQCTAEGAAAAARQLVSEGVDIVVGFLCTAEIEAALPILSEASIPVLDVGVRTHTLTDRRERTGHLVWRIAPRTQDEADALARFVRENWRDEAFGIVEDGSVDARDLADEVRARLGPESIEPSLVDNYRPAEEVQFALARRIAQSGVTRLLVFGSREDVSIIARDAAELDLELEWVGGESLLDEPGGRADLPNGIRAVAIDDQAADYPFATAGAIVREGYHGPAFAAAETAIEAVRRSRAEGENLADILNEGAFPTVLGPVSFDERGDWTREAFRVLVWDGRVFSPAPRS